MNAITTGASASAPLVFQSTTFEVIDRNGQPWLRLHQLAEALGYGKGGAQSEPTFAVAERRVRQIYSRHAAEFTDSMTALVKLPTPGGEQEVRIFSLRGAHLLGMFARTRIAAEFRRWVLDILDRETKPPAPVLPHPPEMSAPPRALPWPPNRRFIGKDCKIAARAFDLSHQAFQIYCAQMHADPKIDCGLVLIEQWLPPELAAEISSTAETAAILCETYVKVFRKLSQDVAGMTGKGQA